MARVVDIVVAFLVAHGNHAITKGTIVPLERLGGVFRTDGGAKRGIRFSRGDVTHASFDDWLGSVKPERLFVLSPTRIGEVSNPDMLLVARGNDGHAVYQPRSTSTPRTLLSNKDVVEFVERSAERTALEQRWLDWNAATKWTDDWPTFARAALERGGNDLVEDFGHVLGAASLPEALRTEWFQIERARTNPDFDAIYTLHFLKELDDPPVQTARDEARIKLAAALDAIAPFAASQKLDGWAKRFEAARAALEASDEGPLVKRYFGDAGLDRDALRLLDAAWQADVFGGMGSWNDVPPTGNYTSLSTSLFDALPSAVEAALNTL